MNIIILPVLTGGGKRLFNTDTGRRNLQLVESSTLPGGLIHSVYRR